jgi:UDP-2,4-diacetamido-2,4,6-trideoxy-beta-L-altropyranose hydrolase
MHIAFRVDGNEVIGLGHLMRCLALAQHGQNRFDKISFLVTKATHRQALKREDWVGEIILVEDSLHDVNHISDFCSNNKVDFLVLDGYHFTSEYRKALSLALRETFIVAIDDNNDMGALYAHCIVNPNGHALSLNYEDTQPHSNCCLGTHFRILRKEFVLNEAQRRKAFLLDTRDQLTIILGGADTQNLSLLLADALAKALPNIPINVITGSAYSHSKALDEFTSNSPFVHHLHNVQNVSTVFLRSRLVISAGGSTQYELQALCTPALLLVVANNQYQATKRSSEEGRAHYFNMLDQFDLTCLLSKIIDLWNSSEALANMQRANRTQANTIGADNIFNALLKLKDESGNRCNDHL